MIILTKEHYILIRYYETVGFYVVILIRNQETSRPPAHVSDIVWQSDENVEAVEGDMCEVINNSVTCEV
jgi:hypothetical protein